MLSQLSCFSDCFENKSVAAAALSGLRSHSTHNNLPGETRNYVPEILAAIIIANHPTQYGFDEITLDPPVLTDTVTINYSADLRLISDIVGAPVDELIALNPSLLRMVTPPDTEFDLHLPAGTAALFQEKIAAIPVSKRDSWRYHKITPDDTLASVAHTYSVSVSALADANQLDSTSKLDGLEALLVPVPQRAASTSHTVYYTTRRGDTLVSVADRFGISLSQLRRWNKLPASGIRVDAGRRLHVAEPTVVRASTTRIPKRSIKPHPNILFNEERAQDHINKALPSLQIIHTRAKITCAMKLSSRSFDSISCNVLLELLRMRK